MTSPSLASVYRQHHAFVWRTLRCLGVTDSAVDDAVQDVFLVVHRKLDAFEGRAAVRTWLYEIARRVAWRHRQRAQADAARSFELPDLHEAPDLEDAVARAQALEILRAFLGRIDEDKAAVYVLAELGGLHGSEIAADLGVNVNTVHARLRAARRELHRVLVRLRARDRSLPSFDRIAPAVLREQPTAEQQRRTWAAVAAQLGLAPGVPVAATMISSTTAWVVGTVVASAAVVAIGLGWERAEAPAARPTSAPAHASSRPSHDEEPPAPPSPSIPALDRGEGGALGPSSAQAIDGTPARRPRRAARAGDGPQEAEPDAAPSDALQRELALVEQIRAARREDAPRALDLVVRHRKDHPQGALASEVDALEIEALCASGERERARRAAERFATRWPESSLRADFAGACELASR